MTTATCLGCGLACDDIDVTIEGDRIVAVRDGCPAAVRWFGDGRTPGRIVVDGDDTTLDAALGVGASLLASAAMPLVYLAPDVTLAAHRAAVAIGDRLRARVDSVTSATAAAAILAAQERGRATATLGEVRNRADLIVFWGIDPTTRLPRFATRVAPDAVGVHVPRGRADRTVIAVDVGDAHGPADADLRFPVAAADEVATLAWAAAGQGALADALRAGRYVVIVADGETGEGADAERESATGPARIARADGLIALAQALNAETRAALVLLRGGGNRTGPDAVLTWATGYPMAVDFARGAPRYRPRDGSASTLLARGRVDAALVVGALDRVPAVIQAGLHAVRTVVVGPRASEWAGSSIAIDTPVAGIGETGTALRMDDIPLPVRALVSGPPAATEVLRALTARIVETISP